VRLPVGLPSFALLRDHYGRRAALLLVVGFLRLGTLAHAAVLIILEVYHYFLLLAGPARVLVTHPAAVQPAQLYRYLSLLLLLLLRPMV